MENRNSREPVRSLVSREPVRSLVSRAMGMAAFLCALAAALGCGAPGEPTPPSPQIPVAITDLAVHQAGDAAQLTFTLPAKTVKGERLRETPAVEILRGALKPDGSPDPKSFRVVQTIPGALVENYRADDRVQLNDTISSDELRAHREATFSYRARTRASRTRPSADSNTASVRLLPVAERITSLRATPTKTEIDLTWAAPTSTSTGEALGSISEYHVYRGEIDPSSTEAAAKDLSQAKWKSSLASLGGSVTPDFRDANFEFGHAYVYTVRTVTPLAPNVESGDSLPAIITPQNVYPPSAPQGLVAAVIVGNPTNPPEVDLSWSINPETDLAGYHVYRSEQQETRGELVTPVLLLSPAYRDTSVRDGRRYWYTVTAVDRAGNESAPSAPVAVDLTQPSS